MASKAAGLEEMLSSSVDLSSSGILSVCMSGTSPDPLGSASEAQSGPEGRPKSEVPHRPHSKLSSGRSCEDVADAPVGENVE